MSKNQVFQVWFEKYGRQSEEQGGFTKAELQKLTCLNVIGSTIKDHLTSLTLTKDQHISIEDSIQMISEKLEVCNEDYDIDAERECSCDRCDEANQALIDERERDIREKYYTWTNDYDQMTLEQQQEEHNRLIAEHNVLNMHLNHNQYLDRFQKQLQEKLDCHRHCLGIVLMRRNGQKMSNDQIERRNAHYDQQIASLLCTKKEFEQNHSKRKRDDQVVDGVGVKEMKII